MPIAYEQDGRTVIVNPAPGFDAEAVAAQTVPDGVAWRVVTDDEVAALIAAEPLPLDPVPAVISDRQFFQQLALDGYITTAEALAAVRTGDLPPVLADLLDHMDGDERFGAEMLLSGATEFRRDHAMTIAIGEARGLTPDEVDDFFRRAVAL
ncbi:hypothetical protein GBZ26_11265 [Azospirillum formosense]|uniref:Uncharacterized protein n=1 Tax=Azospirillum formosense TaxID=861533 RepID=A0ABX2KZY4_9PROT|nr:hypothetical protein [Azospirillum formosense]MBY3756710.1 hypothetical protein [Azospirillum formosense]NUB19790.1 hypothetical protein [Azospirillum formosense]